MKVGAGGEWRQGALHWLGKGVALGQRGFSGVMLGHLGD
jgi:hypothetical protein